MSRFTSLKNTASGRAFLRQFGGAGGVEPEETVVVDEVAPASQPRITEKIVVEPTPAQPRATTNQYFVAAPTPVPAERRSAAARNMEIIRVVVAFTLVALFASLFVIMVIEMCRTRRIVQRLARYVRDASLHRALARPVPVADSSDGE